MAKSIEEMITSYVDKFITSEENRNIIYRAVLNEKRRTVQYFYEQNACNLEETITMEEFLNMSNYDFALEKFGYICLQADCLYCRYLEGAEDSQTILTSLLYIYIKLHECAAKLDFLKIVWGTGVFSKEKESLDETVKLLDTIVLVIEKIEKNNKKDRDIEFVDLVVKTNVFKCNKNHNIEQVQANVSVVDCFGDIEKIKVPVGYCRECNCYFILERDFFQLKQQGVILCRIISEKVYRNAGYSNSFDLKTESLLHQAGYNVSSTENLSSVQRKEILKRVVDNGLYSISGLCSFLDYLIDKNERVVARDMSSAISKWLSDRNFIANYNSAAQRNVNVASFIKNDYEYDDDELPF